MTSIGTKETAAGKSDFVAAEEIKQILEGRESAEQSRIIRWVSESLCLGPSPTSSQEAPAPLPLPTVDSRGGTTDIRTFTQQKAPKNDIQFVAVAAYYYRFLAPLSDRKDFIGSSDLQTSARLASRPVFKKPTTTFNNAVQQGYMDRRARGEYCLNTVGENLVAMTLPGNGADSSAKPRSTKKSTAKKKGVAAVKKKRTKSKSK